MPNQASISLNERAQTFWIDNAVLDQYVPRIGPYGFLVYCALVRKSENSPPWTQAQIAQEIRCGISTVREAIEVLVELGLVEVKSGKREGGPNIYGVQAVPILDAPLSKPPKGTAKVAKSNLIPMAGKPRRANPEDQSLPGNDPLFPDQSLPEVVPNRCVATNVPREILTPSNASFKNTTKTNTTAKTDRKKPAVELTEDQLRAAVEYDQKRPGFIDAIDRAYKKANPGLEVPWTKRAFGQVRSEERRVGKECRSR